MIRLSLALCLAVLTSISASAQGCGPTNPNCVVFTAPPGTNNDRAASTAFVQQATGALNAISALTGDVVATGPGSVVATIQAGVVTSAKMAAGAAATNVGTLGGSLTGTLPNPGIASGAVTGTNIASGTVTNSNLANTTAGDSYKGKIGAAGTPTDNAWSNCNGNNSALQYTNGSGTGCNSNLMNLTTTGQSFSGGYNIVTNGRGVLSGNTQIDCSQGFFQSYTTTTGTSTFLAPTSDGSCFIQVIGTSAFPSPTIGISGFATSPTGTGDTFTSTATTTVTVTSFTITSPCVVNFSSGAYAFVNNMVVWMQSSGSLPTGVSGFVNYYVATATVASFTLSTTPNNANPVTCSGSATGTATITVPSVFLLDVNRVQGISTAIWKQQQ